MGKEENQAINAILDFFTLQGWPCWRNNNQAVFDPTKKTFRKPPKGYMKGVADIQALQPDGPSWFIEVKTKGYPSLSKDQKKFKELVEKADHVFVQAYGLDEIFEAFKEKAMSRESQDRS